MHECYLLMVQKCSLAHCHMWYEIAPLPVKGLNSFGSQLNLSWLCVNALNHCYLNRFVNYFRGSSLYMYGNIGMAWTFTSNIYITRYTYVQTPCAEMEVCS